MNTYVFELYTEGDAYPLRRKIVRSGKSVDHIHAQLPALMPPYYWSLQSFTEDTGPR